MVSIKILLLLSAIICITLFLRTLYIILFTPTLKTSAKLTFNAPLVSILLPVRNEESRILRENVKSLISQNYPQLEIVAVDDQSTDKSFDILQEFSNLKNSKMKALRGNEPPDDCWIGKTHALYQAKQVAKGDWLVSVDADVIYSNNIISAAMEYAQKNKLDALSLLPRVLMVKFWETVVLPVVSWLSLMRVSTTQANRSNSKACFGYGNFILFRGSAHDSIGGFESYKNDILDDCAIMERLKAHGFRIRIIDGSKLMKSKMYAGLKEIILGFRKNTFAALRNSIIRSVAVILSEILFIFFPPIYIIHKLLITTGEWSLSTFCAIVAVGSFFLTMLLFGLRMKAGIKFYFFYIIGHAIAIFIIAYSMISYFTKKGTIWKDRTIVKKKNSGK